MKNITAVAVSGGIDSLVAAFLLKKQGAEITGVHFVTGFEDNPAINAGTDYLKITPDDYSKTPGFIAQISSQLEITVHVIDIRNEFKATVADYFYRSYLDGLTPNPCIVCNAKIKFGLMIEKALGLGASNLATGHYTRLITSGKDSPKLMKSLDQSKDQSYFLSCVDKKAFERVIFPLADLTKDEVRQIAKDNGLTPPVSKESQDICFIKGGYSDFMESYPDFKAKPGDIVDTSGTRIGGHKGLHLFTIGQRKGINCPAKEPYYVVRLDTEKNRLVAGFKNDLLKSGFMTESMNWFRKLSNEGEKLLVKIRYAHKASEAFVKQVDEDVCNVEFEEPQLSVTPGQTAVFYDGDEVVGAGIISRY